MYSWSTFQVFMNILKMTAFRRLSDEDGNSAFNFRSTQPLNHRTVQYYKATGLFLEEPNMVSVRYGNWGDIMSNMATQIVYGFFQFIKIIFKILLHPDPIILLL